MFSKIRTSIRVREWNKEISKYKKLTPRGQIKNAEYTQSSQGEAMLTRAQAYIPTEEFPEPMSDAALVAFLESDEPAALC